MGGGSTDVSDVPTSRWRMSGSAQASLARIPGVACMRRVYAAWLMCVTAVAPVVGSAAASGLRRHRLVERHHVPRRGGPGKALAHLRQGVG